MKRDSTETLVFCYMTMNNPEHIIALNSVICEGVEGDDYLIVSPVVDGILHNVQVKLIDGCYYIHCEDGIGIQFKRGGIVYTYFHVDGIACRIEDLKCSGEMKLMLKLRYGDCVASGCYFLYE